jgi:hypothetical protein
VPRGIELHIPFPCRISPDADRARQRHLAWPRSHGLLNDEEAVRRHESARYAELAARFYPDATGADLDLGVDLTSWFFVFDDLFDGPSGEDPVRAQALVSSTMEALRRPAGQSAAPVVRAFSDLWSAERVTPAQRQGFFGFGLGRRKCIGDTFGLTEAAIAVVAILGRWRLEHTGPVTDRPLIGTLLMAPATRMRVRAR